MSDFAQGLGISMTGIGLIGSIILVYFLVKPNKELQVRFKIYKFQSGDLQLKFANFKYIMYALVCSPKKKKLFARIFLNLPGYVPDLPG